MTAPYTKHDAEYALMAQATFGTQLTGTQTFSNANGGFLIDCEPTAFSRDVKERRPNRSQNSTRYLSSKHFEVDQKGSMPSVSFAGNAKLYDVPIWLYAVMQNVSEDATIGQFNKTYTWPSTQPDFNASAGWFGTIVKRQPVATRGESIFDAICSELILSAAPGSNEDRLRFQASMVGRGPVDLNYDTSASTFTRNASTYFPFHDLNVCTINGTVVHPVGIEIKLSNGAVPVGVDQSSDSKFRTFGLIEYACDMKLSLIWDGNVNDIVKNLESSGSVAAYVIQWGSDATVGNLKFTIQGSLIESPDVEGDIKTVDLNVRAVENGGTTPVSIVVTDGVDRAW